jgi:hypothetical protein
MSLRWCINTKCQLKITNFINLKTKNYEPQSKIITSNVYLLNATRHQSNFTNYQLKKRI